MRSKQPEARPIFDGCPEKPESKKRGLVFIVSGPSGSGKTTLIKRLLRDKGYKGNLAKIVTCTTREPRGKEKDGRDYIFLSKKEFKGKKEKREFLEWQKVFGEYYGTPLADVKKNILLGRGVILCIDVKGAKALKANKHFRFVRIFILPSQDNWRKTLKTRLKLRLSESQEQIKKRLKLAEQEIASSKDYDYVVVNKDINEATEELVSIVASERKR
ncbi:MAG: guanylate kinase [Candidatus Omnitrophota bacterium]